MFFKFFLFFWRFILLVDFFDFKWLLRRFCEFFILIIFFVFVGIFIIFLFGMVLLLFGCKFSCNVNFSFLLFLLMFFEIGFFRDFLMDGLFIFLFDCLVYDFFFIKCWFFCRFNLRVRFRFLLLLFFIFCLFLFIFILVFLFLFLGILDVFLFKFDKGGFFIFNCLKWL